MPVGGNLSLTVILQLAAKASDAHAAAILRATNITLARLRKTWSKTPVVMNHEYAGTEPSRAEVDAIDEPVVVEFGTPWCGYCRAAQPLLEAAFAEHPDVRHIKIEDGKGRRLGRTFGVKLWPTLIFLRRGAEVARLVRPADQASIRQALAQIDTA